MKLHNFSLKSADCETRKSNMNSTKKLDKKHGKDERRTKDLLVSGDAIVDTMTGGPVRRLNF